MVSSRFRIRFGSRFLLLCITLACFALWWFQFLPWQFHREQLASGQSLIHDRDRLHISQCFDKPALDRLITVLGDSRLTHWASVRWLLRPDPKTIVSYGSDNALIVWNYEDGSIRRGFFDATCAAYAPGAQRLYWIDSEKALYELSLLELDAEPRKVPSRFKPAAVPHLISSHDGRYLVYSGMGTPIWIWDRQSSDEAELLAIQRTQLEQALACPPSDPSVLVSGGSVLVEHDLASGASKKTFRLPADGPGTVRVSACVFSPDGQTLTVGDAAGRIFEFDWSTGSRRGELISNQNTITALSAGANTLLAAGGGVQRYHWQGEPRKIFIAPVTSSRVTSLSPDLTALGAFSGGRIVEFGAGPRPMKGGMGSDATCFAFSPDGKQIAVAGRDGQIVIRDTHRWRLLRSWRAHAGEVQRLIWTSDDQPRLISTGDQMVVFWDPVTAEETASASLWTSMSGGIALAPADDRLVMSGNHQESLAFYKRSSMEKLDAVTLDQLRIRGDVLFTKDGASLVTGGNQNTINVWNIAAKKTTASLGGVTNDNVRLALSTDGNIVYAVTGNHVSAFDLSAAKPLWTVKHAALLQDVCSHPSRPVVAAAASDGAVTLYEAGTGKVIQRLRIGPTAGKLTQVEFSPDGSLLAIAMSNGSVVVLQSPVD